MDDTKIIAEAYERQLVNLFAVFHENMVTGKSDAEERFAEGVSVLKTAYLKAIEIVNETIKTKTEDS